MKLQIKKNTVPIPHCVMFQGRSYEFTPACDVPDEFGKALLANQSNIYEAVGGETKLGDVAGYKVRVTAKNIQELYDSLTPEAQVDVYQYAQALADGAKKPKPPVTPPVVPPVKPPVVPPAPPAKPPAA